MSYPASQLSADRFSSAGGFGVAPFGISPFGGEDWPPTTLPTITLGSDDLTRILARNVADIVHTRRGQPVSVRPFSNWAAWRVQHTMLTEAQLDELWVFCQVRVFRLLPAGDPGTYYTVYWTDGDFKPEPMGNGLYSLSYTLEEVAT